MINLDVMESFGKGYCTKGYYAGWDGQGEANQDDCNNLCLREHQCTFAAYMNIGSKKTCSRYNGKSCTLETKATNAMDHQTFAKKGLPFVFLETYSF